MDYVVAIIVGIVAHQLRGRNGWIWGCIVVFAAGFTKVFVGYVPIVTPIIIGTFALAALFGMPILEFDPETNPDSGLKKCSDCAEIVKAEAKKCKHCGATLIPKSDDVPS